MNEVDVVIGAAFGDEGKGLVTAALTKYWHQAGESVVVYRHNGGAQAGHTVEESGHKHVFHSLSSGTFNSPYTAWGPEFLIDPLMVTAEIVDLQKIVKDHYIIPHPECPLVTPFDVIINCALEEKRAGKAHGSCGLGIFECVNRTKTFPLRYKHISANIEYRTVLEQIQRYYVPARLQELGLTYEDINEEDREYIQSTDAIDQFVTVSLALQNLVMLNNPQPLNFAIERVIFEGAQGLFLDQNNLDMWPHLTPSNTGLENVGAILRENNVGKEFAVNAYYVSRVYFTRHGNGPLPNELTNRIGEADDTNFTNQYQGELRYAPLDLDLLKKHIESDLKKFAVKYAYSVNLNIVLTHANLLVNSEKGLVVIYGGQEVLVQDSHNLADLVKLAFSNYDLTDDRIHFSFDKETLTQYTDVEEHVAQNLLRLAQ